MTEQEPLVEIIFGRLAAEEVPSGTADLVLAAMSSSEDLADVLAGKAVSLAGVQSTTEDAREHIYLSSVKVAGFRGIGPERTLKLAPRPGLTIVVGRNGSGKSSFAESAELSLTGNSVRWADRNSVWRTGWRNLHVNEPCAITTELRIDGVARTTTVRRSWSAGAALESADSRVTTPEGRFRDLSELGLTRPLSLYRPFLTAADLSKLIDGTPSAIFDALGRILGLDGLTDADRRLRQAIRAEEDSIKQVRNAAVDLRARLGEVTDERASRAAAVLAKPKPSLEALGAMLAEPIDGGADANLAAYQKLAELKLDDLVTVADLVAELRAAAESASGPDETVRRIAVRVAELLRLGLSHHADLGDGPCPLCRTGTLDADWHRAAAESLTEMDEANAEAATARRTMTELSRRAARIGAGIDLSGDAAEVDVSALRDALARLHTMPTDAAALADHLLFTYPRVLQAAAAVRTAAMSWIDNRDGAWRPLADELRGWLANARRAGDSERRVTLLRAARAWLLNSAAEIRNERLAPFAEQSQQIWHELRQESNVELGTMTLVGTNTSRRVEFPVSVDGVDSGTALGVMSQGEMHALGLATFLPRSCADESPFRFIIIDDPVQSMDPAKVDGLARVLATLAKDRQVVVFTHDSRLPQAVSRLEIDADVLEVVRAEGSVVTIRPMSDPVERYLDDARAIAKTDNLDEDVRRPVVAELCRSAIEAACARVVWRAQLTRGRSHGDIERSIEAAKTTRSLAALALFGDAKAGSRVADRLKTHGRRAIDAFEACVRGVHAGYDGALPQLVDDTRFLIGALS